MLHTVEHLKPTQVVYQVKNRLVKKRYKPYEAPKHDRVRLSTEPIPRFKGVEGKTFTFLNLSHDFSDWNFVGHGTLWTYNLNYFDFLNQEGEGQESRVEGQEVGVRSVGISAEEGCRWIDRFIQDRPTITWGMDPYPIALRCINWIKFFDRHPECATQERENSLYSQYRLLWEKLEYHLLANHLLEDAYSLYFTSAYFQDAPGHKKAYSLLLSQLKEQVLPDGAHYEQSPMYHCVLLDRLLDCINIAPTKELCSIAQRMIGWLKGVSYQDKTIPLFNDAAVGIAPTPADIIDYAHRLGIDSEATPLGVSGYRKMTNKTMEAMVDVGNVTATYQPGHTHADTFNYELRIEGKPFVVDTGISTYDKTPRRQYERSTAAHNCVCAVSVEGQGAGGKGLESGVKSLEYGGRGQEAGGKGLELRDSSEVWGGFRVGNRCKVLLKRDEPNHLEASHDGFGRPCSRVFKMEDGAFVVEDNYEGRAVSLIHLAGGTKVKSQESGVWRQEPGVKSQESRVKGQESGGESLGSRGEGREDGCRVLVDGPNGVEHEIFIEEAERVEVVEERVSTEYNKFDDIQVLKIYFNGRLKYSIR